MVAKSKKGTLTKQNIINAAKQLFYENGYNKTGIQDIADYANVKLGTITYYFKKKDDMISDIYNTFFMALYDYVSEASEKDLNLYTKYCFTLVLYYNAILSDPHNTLLYYEVLVKDVDNGGRLSITKTLNRSCLDFLNKSYTDEDLDVIAMAEFGSPKKNCSSITMNAKLNFERDQMCFYFVKTLFRLMDLDGDMIQNTIKQAFDFLRNKIRSISGFWFKQKSTRIVAIRVDFYYGLSPLVKAVFKLYHHFIGETEAISLDRHLIAPEPFGNSQFIFIQSDGIITVQVCKKAKEKRI